MGEVATVLTTVLGHPVRAESVSPEQALAAGLHAGWVRSQEWTNEVGYRADLGAAKSHGIVLTSFARWVERHRDDPHRTLNRAPKRDRRSCPGRYGPTTRPGQAQRTTDHRSIYSMPRSFAVFVASSTRPRSRSTATVASIASATHGKPQYGIAWISTSCSSVTLRPLLSPRARGSSTRSALRCRSGCPASPDCAACDPAPVATRPPRRPIRKRSRRCRPRMHPSLLPPACRREMVRRASRERVRRRAGSWGSAEGLWRSCVSPVGVRHLSGVSSWFYYENIIHIAQTYT